MFFLFVGDNFTPEKVKSITINLLFQLCCTRMKLAVWISLRNLRARCVHAHENNVICVIVENEKRL